MKLAGENLASPFEAHHSLNDRLAGFGDLALFASAIDAVFAELLGLAVDLDGFELIDLVATSLANRHAPTFRDGRRCVKAERRSVLDELDA